MPKYVASSTLRSLEWHNTTVLDGDLVEQVRQLKAQDGDDILIHGFGPVAKTLLRAGLLDQLHLWYHPAFAGVGDAGDRLFDPGLTARLTHAGTRELKSGVVVLSYRAGNS
jgi:dihydrofolate reductase